MKPYELKIIWDRLPQNYEEHLRNNLACDLKLPNRPLYDYELLNYARTLKLKHFRGIFMNDTLPRIPWVKESAIINLDSSNGSGTHWVAYVEDGNSVEYFDSFGNLKPSKELVSYLNCNIFFIIV